MSLSTNPYQSYRQNQVETADQVTLILMLYNGALKFLRQGRDAMDKGETEEANRLLGRTQDILAELIGSLNPDAGDITVKLYSIYEYAYHLITEAIINKDIKLTHEAEKLLIPLKEAWQHIKPELDIPVSEE